MREHDYVGWVPHYARGEARVGPQDQTAQEGRSRAKLVVVDAIEDCWLELRGRRVVQSVESGDGGDVACFFCAVVRLVWMCR